jgi:aspartate kinase
MALKTALGKQETLVMKFGGTSVGTAGAMRQVVAIVVSERKKWKNLVVVTSALSGVTDLLLSMASGETDLAEAAETLRNRHSEIAEALIPEKVAREAALLEVRKIIDQIVNLCQAVAVLGEATPRVVDTIASAGERMCIHILAAAIRTQGVLAQPIEATRLIRTDDHFTDALIGARDRAGHHRIFGSQRKGKYHHPGPWRQRLFSSIDRCSFTGG